MQGDTSRVYIAYEGAGDLRRISDPYCRYLINTVNIVKLSLVEIVHNLVSENRSA